ncbi:MAG: pyrroline-5-carboxylate reductase [Vampirovibrionia bacterium]
MLKNKKIVIIGAGTMGKALIQGLIESGEVTDIKAVEKDKKNVLRAQNELNIPIVLVSECSESIKNADVIVLCVKPQDIKNFLLLVKKDIRPETLIISIAAGVSTSYIEAAVNGLENPVVRAMPNTPCLIREGMIVICRGTHANLDHINISQALFSCLGECVELEEKLMNAVTGVSGSGPAFIYLIIEALSDGGVMEGLPRKVANRLVARTLLGAAKMVLETGKHPAELKDDVSTPAGCTIGALLSLEDGRIRSVLARGVQEASRIASRLGTED